MTQPIKAHVGFGDDTASGVAEQLRHAMSHWPSGVGVLATKVRGRIEAVTVNSFVSASLNPPLILVSISRNAFILPNLAIGSGFTISALSATQGRVASMIVDRVPDLSKLFNDDELPAIRGSLFMLSCVSHAQYDAGDHVLVLGRVERVQIGEVGDPLLYLAGRFTAINRG